MRTEEKSCSEFSLLTLLALNRPLLAFACILAPNRLHEFRSKVPVVPLDKRGSKGLKPSEVRAFAALKDCQGSQERLSVLPSEHCHCGILAIITAEVSGED